MTDHHYTLEDGRTLAWREVGEGPPLVLLHGWSISGLAFVELSQRLGKDFRALIPDLPGHGDSSPAPEPGLTNMASDLFDWLSAVVSEPVVLAGWSLGGMVAMEMARQSPQRLSGLVLIGTTPRFTAAADWPHGLPVGHVKALRRNLSRHFEKTLGEFFNLTFAGEAVAPELLRAVRRKVVYPGRLPDPQGAAALLDLLAVQDQRAFLSEIGLPSLVIHGEKDHVSPVGAGRVLAEQLPDAEFVMIEDVAHAPFWSRPEQVAGLFRGALAWAR